MSKIQKKEEGRIDEAGGATEGEKLPEVGSEPEVMKGLLEEANGMLKGMSTKSAEEDRLAAMRRQLDDLKKMKVFRLTKLSSTGPAHGLLDSGATNPLRGRTMNDDMEAIEKVWVTLATGARVAMKITKAGVMVSEDEKIEPIVPLGMLGGQLWYEVIFKNGECQIHHPVKGGVPAGMKNGCPQIAKEVAFRIIDDIEEGVTEAKRMSVSEKYGEARWIEEFVEARPILRHLPAHIKKSLKEVPSPGLRRPPAGKKEGYWIGRAVKEIGRDPGRLAEIDIERDEEGDQHDMLKKGGV